MKYIGIAFSFLYASAFTIAQASSALYTAEASNVIVYERHQPSELKFTVKHVLVPGDIIHIKSSDHPDLSTRVKIDRKGNISIPRVGILKVSELKIIKAHEYLNIRIAIEYFDAAFALMLRKESGLENVPTPYVGKSPNRTRQWKQREPAP